MKILKNHTDYFRDVLRRALNEKLGGRWLESELCRNLGDKVTRSDVIDAVEQLYRSRAQSMLTRLYNGTKAVAETAGRKNRQQPKPDRAHGGGRSARPTKARFDRQPKKFANRTNRGRTAA